MATGDSVAQAEQAYYALLEANGKKTDSSEYKTNELTGAILQLMKLSLMVTVLIILNLKVVIRFSSEISVYLINSH